MAQSTSEIRMTVERRTQFGKGAARRIRRADKIPAVMYGHGTAPVHITLPGHEAMLALKGANAVLTLVIDGDEQLALAKDVQRDPIKPVIEHVDLVVIRLGEKVSVDIAVHVEGDAAPETIVNVENNTLEVLAEATNIPEGITVSVEGLPAGSQIHAAQVTLPAGVELVSDPETLVVHVSQMASEEALESELAEAEAEAGIEHEESDAAAAGAPGVEAPGGEEA